jgi:uncharacterized protein YjbJ (UPF0337 family)
MGSADGARHKADALAGEAMEKIGRATGNQRVEDEGGAGRLRANLKAGGKSSRTPFAANEPGTVLDR